MKKIYSVIVVVVLVSLTMSSCRTSGYGCKGKETWGQMIKRNNRPYQVVFLVNDKPDVSTLGFLFFLTIYIWNIIFIIVYSIN